MSINLFESDFAKPTKKYPFFVLLGLSSIFLLIIFEESVIEGLVVFFCCIFSLNIIFNLRFALKILNEFNETEEEKTRRETKKAIAKSLINVQVKL
jgi:hypothetical protein